MFNAHRAAAAATQFVTVIAVAAAMPALSARAADGDPLRDVSAAAGLDFVHFNGMSGELYFPEMMGAGAALFDYDGDGDLDAYLVQGHMLGAGKTIDDASIPPRHEQLIDRLYRNDSERDASGRMATLRFTDVTLESGIIADGYGMGVTTGDIDNDGDVDLYLSNYGHNQLWRNNGDGTFSDITTAAGADDPRWSVSASFFDYDRDGWLDLYVGNYLQHDLGKRRECRLSKRVRDYCGPLMSAGEVDRLLHNRGDGTFENVTHDSGIDGAHGGALGVSTADFNGDGWIDIYVANDGVANQLWLNQRDGTFRDEALLAGVAVNGDGTPEASMGVDAADFDGDGDEDLFMTHLISETNTLYTNDGKGWFEDRSAASGLGNPSLAKTGFGSAWFDLDNDGWLDLLVVNGAVKKNEALVLAGDPYPLHEANELFLNRGDGRFVVLGERGGAAMKLSEVSRGAAFGDVDNDGDSDVLVSNNAGPARLLRNHLADGAGWIGARLLEQGRDAYGARAALLQEPGTMWRRVRSDGSYASASDPRILFGLGGKPAPRYDLLVVWPDGSEERWSGLQPGRYHELRRGAGTAAEIQ